MRVTSLEWGATTTLEMTKYWARGSTDVIAVSRDSAFCWGHYCDELSADTIAFADNHTTSLESLFPSDTYSRVTNALRLYTGALNLQNADLVF